MANVYNRWASAKGDRVVLYMPMIPEAAYAMLACARIGAIHSIVFRRVLARALGRRINGCERQVRDHRRRSAARRQQDPLKANVDAGACDLRRRANLVVKRTGADVDWATGAICVCDDGEPTSADCPPER